MPKEIKVLVPLNTLNNDLFHKDDANHGSETMSEAERLVRDYEISFFLVGLVGLGLISQDDVDEREVTYTESKIVEGWAIVLIDTKMFFIKAAVRLPCTAHLYNC